MVYQAQAHISKDILIFLLQIFTYFDTPISYLRII